jgi:CheY-like chemotaxis protein
VIGGLYGNNIVLIVDDVEINRDMLAELFSNDYSIVEARTASRLWK